MPSHASGHVALGSSLFLTLALGLGLALAACGGGDGAQAPGAQVPSSPAASVAPAGTETAPGAAPAAVSPGATAVAPPGSEVPMRAIAPSTMAEDLKKIGIDPLKPPPLSKLTPDQIRKLMPTFAKSLGVKCVACHDVNNFKASTPHKRVAANMWNQFVVGLASEDGTPLYCDSCHGGRMEILDRHDKKALSAWMDANYVSRLKRADKSDHSCETCHGEPFEARFVAKWEKGK